MLSLDIAFDPMVFPVLLAMCCRQYESSSWDAWQVCITRAVECAEDCNYPGTVAARDPDESAVIYKWDLSNFV